MSKLQILSVFLTERLTLAAQEIFKAVEDIFSEYNEEICRSRQEIELLKRRLQQAGVQLDSVKQLCSTETQGQKYTQTFSEEWRSEHDLKDKAMHMILDICTKEEENEEDMPVCGESASLSPCMDIYHDQTPSKDTETQVMDSCSENNFHFIDQAARIKNEPETNTETGTTCQIQQNITKQDLDDSGASDASSDVNKVKVSHGGSPSHETQTFILPLRNQEMLTQHRMELAQIRERMSLKIQPCDSECKSKKSQPSVCQDEVSKSDKQKPDNARYSQAWRDRLKKDPVKFAEFKAFEAARAREYRRKRTATAVEIDKDNNRERQRRFRTKKKLQHKCKADDNPLPPKKTKVLTEEERMKKREYDRMKKREERERMGAEKKRQIRERDASRKREKRKKTKNLTDTPHTNFGTKSYSWN
ncbi:stress response protein NST1-like [Cyprinus carpio]|uniref:Stress response protein NST1-like n=1 Tax=Cyprinus carpio TaxID=7962 RepID=A0A9Q9VFI9_CYPCA|nr:stress response protein NST1-like [Cyprinus carpio]